MPDIDNIKTVSEHEVKIEHLEKAVVDIEGFLKEFRAEVKNDFREVKDKQLTLTKDIDRYKVGAATVLAIAALGGWIVARWDSIWGLFRP